MFNQFSGIGNLAADPQSQVAASGTTITNITVCCEHGWGDNKKTEFVRCVAFGKLADIVRDYSSKGNKAFIQGSMQTDSYEKDGQKVYSTKIILDTFKNLSPKSESSGQAPPQPEIPPQPGMPPQTTGGSDDQVPF